MLTYYKHCVMPNTKPDLLLDGEGACNACRSYEMRKEVDWDLRYKELLQVLKKYRRPDGSNWDCIVPVTGGKDSTYQVMRMLQLGLNPLCVTSITWDLADIGRKNIENLKHLGVDYIEVSPNPIVRAKPDGRWQCFSHAGTKATGREMCVWAREMEDRGAGAYQHMVDAVTRAGASVIAAASMFHFTEQTSAGAKVALAAAGVPVRKAFPGLDAVR